MSQKIKIGLVLSGGGSRGAYQAGAMKAIKDLKLVPYFSVVAGTSTGAINGAAFVQGDIEIAEYIWKNLSFENIFTSIKKSRYFYLKLGYVFLTKGGANVDPLKKLIRENIDYDKIYNNKCDFGLVTFNFSSFKPKYLYKHEIERENLIDFIIASSTFPVFKRHFIKDQSFLDGGLYDNLPLELVVNHKSKPDLVICINVSDYDSMLPFTSATYTRLKNATNYLEITPSEPLGSIFNFDKKFTTRYFNLGYNDTFEKLFYLSRIIRKKI